MPTLIILSDVSVGDINQERSKKKETEPYKCSVSYSFSTDYELSLP